MSTGAVAMVRVEGCCHGESRKQLVIFAMVKIAACCCCLSDAVAIVIMLP